MSAYLVVSLDVDDADTFKRYQRAVVKSFGIGEGKVIAATKDAETLEGAQAPNWNVIVQFPSLDLAHRWWNSPEYAEIKPIRLASSSSSSVRLLEGF